MDDPLYRARRTLHTGIGLLTDRQRQRLEQLFADDADVQVEGIRGTYQRIINRLPPNPTGPVAAR
jgi:transposase